MRWRGRVKLENGSVGTFCSFGPWSNRDAYGFPFFSTMTSPFQVFSTEKVSIFVMEFRFPNGLSRLTSLAAPVASTHLSCSFLYLTLINPTPLPLNSYIHTIHSLKFHQQLAIVCYAVLYTCMYLRRPII